MLEWLLGACAAAAGGYGLFILPTQWLKVERVKHPAGLDTRIVQISDLHVERLRIPPVKLERILKREEPDLIMLTGDFTRKLRYLPRLEPYLQAVVSVGVPVYAVPGNHDYKMGSAGIPRLNAMLDRYGIRLLRNESVLLEKFRLVGVDNFGTGHSRLRPSFRDCKDGEKAVIITHDPNLVPHLNRSYEYLMAGHFHGKQFNLPYFFKLKPKGELPAMGIYKGLHRWGKDGWFYISKGIGQVGINARLFVRSEITVHDL